MQRIWDPDNKYESALIKEYPHWVVEVSFRQHTLGCFIIFCKRAVERISELRDDEIIELKEVMKKTERTLATNHLFRPDRFNYFQMGNALHHLHFHGIPRYATPRQFAGKTWTDTTWGHPPVWSNKDVGKELVIEIKEALGN